MNALTSIGDLSPPRMLMICRIHRKKNPMYTKEAKYKASTLSEIFKHTKRHIAKFCFLLHQYDSFMFKHILI